MPQIEGLKTTELYFLTTPRGRSPTSRCWQLDALLEALRENAFQASPQALLVLATLGALRLVGALLQPLPLPSHSVASVSLSLNFPPHTRTPVTGLGPNLIQSDLILP